MRVIIIGGGAAGASCATRLRRLNENAEIIILERTREVSIANCGLPYYISDVIPNRDSILVSTPQKFKSWFNIDVRLETEVIEINKEEKFVITSSNEKLSYDYLVLANGASPIVPNFAGLNKDKTFVVRTLNDADKIKSYIKNNPVKKVAVIGGGFIGIEIAENLIEMGLDTTLIELNNQILAPVDFEIAKIAQDEMIKKGVNLILSDGVQKFSENQIILNSNNVIDYDLCILAIGVKPESDLARKAGLEINRGIVVDEYLKTSNEFIYAAGDNIEAKDFVSGQNTLLPLAGPANRQGRIVADNICGFNSTYKNTQVVIDVRPNMIYKMGTIEGAINIPIAEIRERLDEIPRDKKVILSCNTGYTSYCASRILAQKSFNNVYSFMGGYELYKELVKESAKLNHA